MRKTLTLEQQLLKSYNQDLNKTDYDYYGLSVFEMDGAEYAIGTDEQCDKACLNYISDSAWTFKASFICNQCSLPDELKEAIQSYQKKECEGCNDTIFRMIENSCGIHDFVESAVRADGRGHFLSPYDGNEMDLGHNIFAYQIN